MGTGKDRLWPTAAGVGREEAPDDVNALYGDLYIPRYLLPAGVGEGVCSVYDSSSCVRATLWLVRLFILRGF